VAVAKTQDALALNDVVYTELSVRYAGIEDLDRMRCPRCRKPYEPAHSRSQALPTLFPQHHADRPRLERGARIARDHPDRFLVETRLVGIDHCG
jgi:hypothetical protein